MTRMERVITQALVETLGPDGVREVLMFAPQIGSVSPSVSLLYSSRVWESLEHVYGIQPGRGLALQVGRQCFKYGLREFGSDLGLADLDFRLLPFPAKVKKGGEALASWIHAHSACGIRFEPTGKRLFCLIRNCPICDGRESDSPCCYPAIGFFQEALYWASGGRSFRVVEEGCRAGGESECKISLDLDPIPL